MKDRNSRAVVFISHITEEKKIAEALKGAIESAFLGLIEVFVSSTPEGLPAGKNWTEVVTEKLRTCVVELLICSPDSLRRPWINFEAGAGWSRDIHVIPMCHSGLVPSNLPLPFILLTGISATSADNLEKRLTPVLADTIGATSVPKIDFSDFVNVVREHENSKREFFGDDWTEAQHGSSGSSSGTDETEMEVFGKIAGRWELNYAAGRKNRAGREILEIDGLGRYWIINLITGTSGHFFNLRVVAANDGLTHVTLAKVKTSDSTVWHNEVLTIAREGDRMDGYAELDGHKLEYRRY